MRCRMKRTGKNLHHYDTTLFGETRKSFEWSYHKTIEELQGYDSTMHWVIAYSGGKDSTTVVTLIAHAIETGLLSPPKSLLALYADTGLEVPPLQQAAL